MMVLPTACEMILRRIREAGGEAYVVGGAVRDMLLGKIPGDHDMTTSLLPEETEELFADHTLVLAGKKHGTVGIVVDGAVYEVTTYRRDGDYHDHRRPDGVSFTRSLREDAARRDFTINAMAYSPEEGVMDFFGGREDLEKGILRAVGNAEIRFEEDALRIMRGIRFAATLGFSVDDATKEAMFGKAENLRDVSGERLAVELQKLLSGKNALPILGKVRDVLAVFLGAQADFSLVWNLADVTMGFMAIVNIIAILMLGKVALRVLENYESQKKQGKHPVFYEDEVGLTGTVWTRENED